MPILAFHMVTKTDSGNLPYIIYTLCGTVLEMDCVLLNQYWQFCGVCVTNMQLSPLCYGWLSSERIAKICCMTSKSFSAQ